MDTTELKNHFSFGENWQSFVETVDEQSITQAINSLNKLFPNGELKGKSFFDIGCGSGLSMLAAALLGASEVHGIDIDPDSVNATKALFKKHAPKDLKWSAREISILDKAALPQEKYEIVHSWGVLHHTGSMWEAIQNASTFVKDNGLFLIALYRKTPLCSFWKVEKQIYSHGSPFLQKLIKAPYIGLYYLRIMLKGQKPKTFIKEYNKSRGMDFYHDIHDWLGGFPYESADLNEVINKVKKIGFEEKNIFDNCAGTKGFFGTGCDEYLFVKNNST